MTFMLRNTSLTNQNHLLTQAVTPKSEKQKTKPFSFQIAVTPTLMDTTIEARDRFQPKDRGCYVGNRNSTELPLKYLPSELYRYEMSNCLFEAAYEEILTKCGCAPSFHQLGAKSVNGTLCSGPGLTCMNGILRFIGKLNKVRDFLPSFFLFCTGFCKGQSTFFETLMSPDSCNFSCGQFSLI